MLYQSSQFNALFKNSMLMQFWNGSIELWKGCESEQKFNSGFFLSEEFNISRTSSYSCTGDLCKVVTNFLT